MKIIIIGAGIAGLSSYLFLTKHLARDHPGQYTIKIYEAYDVHRSKYDAPQSRALDDASDEPLLTPKVIGNAIGLGKNRLSVLRRLDDNGELLKKIQERGNSIAKWRIGTARGWKIVDANVQGDARDGEASSVDTVMIARQVAWEVLRDAVLSLEPEALVQKKVQSIETLDGPRIRVYFTDGLSDTCDLLIGADGLRSIVRQTIFTNHKDHHPRTWTQFLLRASPQKKDYTTPHYESLTGLGGFVPASILQNVGYGQEAMSITFGPNGFFGHGYIGPVDKITDTSAPLAAWWSTFSSDTPRPYQKDDDDAISTGVKTSFDRDAALRDLVKRHQHWSDPAIKQIVAYVEKERAIEHMYPTYTTPELPTWRSGSIILVGDSAHAIQPSSGQGACQALEDSETLALFLKHYLHEVKDMDRKEAVDTALMKYVDLRKPRIAKIYKQSQKMSRRKIDMNIVEEYVMYFVLWLATRLQLWKAYNDELFEYDVPTEVEKAVRV